MSEDTDQKTTTATACSATCRSGKPCGNRGKVEHPEQGLLCGVHARAAACQSECSICLCPVPTRASKQLECGHRFHRRCIRTWFGRGSLTCPMCRAVCLSELGGSHPLLSTRIRHLLRVVPLPPGIPFLAYMLSLLNSPAVLGALDVTAEQQQLLVELVYQSFTQEHFFQYLRQLHM